MLRANAGTDEAHGGKRLRELRISNGLSQARLAKLAGVGCHTVSRWENKQRFRRRSRSLKSILAALELLRRYSSRLTRACEYPKRESDAASSMEECLLGPILLKDVSE
jgi:transcriptional regulator with XRE-family HTH domain